ncbi:cysteine desulfurase family protein [Anaerobacterium chartisolvens]|uniref:cysteine desulfurase n=1 Tax=Anaerobacterium chartisolvens TaxID=1297424 RepID=A0A369AWV1_9FIRM|nr:aminotransferase class V-fold PLP-dependent enzyme [Anaerobacterium chartisolvens]RCX13862.1 cysteine desulfurase family protein [Anaerobacterium chartisolvens]
MIYLDNAATSYPKPEAVYNGVERCMREYCANPGRGGHEMSIASGKAVLYAREIIAAFFNFKNPMLLSFTKNATEALNIAIKGYLGHGDHVITTCMEHNSVIRPLKTLERDAGLEISIIRGDMLGRIDPEDIRKAVKPNTRLIAATLSSNVNGMIMPVREIGKIARETGIAFLLDASQGVGSIDVDAIGMGIDMLAFPGHKGLMGPQGTGGLYVREGLKLKTIMEGGTGSNSESLYQPEIMPDLLESGTVNTPGIVGLGLGIEFIREFGLDKLRSHKHMLTKRFYEGLSENKKAIFYSSPDMEENSGIIAINIKDVDSSEVSHVLDRVYGIATRAGLHCSFLAHNTLGTVKSGIVRFSVSCFNTPEEIDVTVKALNEIILKV